MASIDWGMIGLGALIGVGCREQLKTAGRVAASTAASLASVAANAAQQVAEETQSPEEQAADAKVEEMTRKIDQMMRDLYGQAGQKNGN